MTQSSDRLDRVEAILARLAEQTAADQQSFAERMDQMQRQADLDRQAANERLAELERNNVQLQQEGLKLQRQFSGMTQALGAMAQTQIEILRRIDETQQQVRGLQTENRRILDHLFGQGQ